jgi:transcriptional regulator with XRE-family HTH domain
MQTIGERLEEARKRKGISIREAAEATKIRSEYLQKFEGNSFDLNLPEIYLRGFLRSYAQYLKLNADKIVTDFNGLGLGGRNSKRDTREIFGRIEVPETSAVRDDEPPASPQPAPQPRHSQIHTAPIERPRERGNLIRIGIVAGGAILALVLLVWVIKMVTTSPTTAAGTSAGAPSTSSIGTETITLIALDNVSVKVVQASNDEVLFSGDLLKGESRTITKRGAILVTHNIGKNLQFEKNGLRFRPSVDGYGRARLE